MRGARIPISVQVRPLRLCYMEGGFAGADLYHGGRGDAQ